MIQRPGNTNGSEEETKYGRNFHSNFCFIPVLKSKFVTYYSYIVELITACGLFLYNDDDYHTVIIDTIYIDTIYIVLQYDHVVDIALPCVLVRDIILAYAYVLRTSTRHYSGICICLAY